MRVYLVDDNSFFRATLKTFIAGYLKYKVVGEAASGKEFINNYKNNADIVLMDINMQDIDGIQATQIGTLKDRNLKIIAVSQYAGIADLQKLISAGFKGFVSKTKLFEELNEALKCVLAGGLYYHQKTGLA